MIKNSILVACISNWVFRAIVCKMLTVLSVLDCPILLPFTGVPKFDSVPKFAKKLDFSTKN